MVDINWWENQNWHVKVIIHGVILHQDASVCNLIIFPVLFVTLPNNQVDCTTGRRVHETWFRKSNVGTAFLVEEWLEALLYNCPSNGLYKNNSIFILYSLFPIYICIYIYFFYLLNFINNVWILALFVASFDSCYFFLL